VNASLYSTPGYDAERDFIAVGDSRFAAEHDLVNASEPAATLPESSAVAGQAKIAFASPGSGTTPH